MDVNEHKKRQDEQEDFIKIMCNSMLALLNHNITGNSIEKLKQAETDLQNFLVNK